MQETDSKSLRTIYVGAKPKVRVKYPMGKRVRARVAGIDAQDREGIASLWSDWHPGHTDTIQIEDHNDGQNGLAR